MGVTYECGKCGFLYDSLEDADQCLCEFSSVKKDNAKLVREIKDRLNFITSQSLEFEAM